jgi:hypothetical protein
MTGIRLSRDRSDFAINISDNLPPDALGFVNNSVIFGCPFLLWLRRPDRRAAGPIAIIISGFLDGRIFRGRAQSQSP